MELDKQISGVKRGLGFCVFSGFLLFASISSATITGEPVVSSSTHAENVSSIDSDIDVNWTAAVSSLGGNVTYRYVLDQTASHTLATFTAALATDPETDVLKRGQVDNALTTNFSAVVDGTFYFRLNASDSNGPSVSINTFGPVTLDTVPELAAIPVSPAAGSHTAAIPVTVSGSKFIDGATLTLVNGKQGTTALSDVLLTSVFRVNENQITAIVPINTQPGSYDIKIVNGLPHQLEDQSASSYTSTNQLPIANAGVDQNLSLTGANITINLDASASSDADDGIATYTWTVDSDPSSSIANPGSSNSPTFSNTVSAPGTYIFSLVVNDGFEDSVADSVTVTVTSTTANNPPVANAGADQLVVPGTQVALNGSASSDADAGTSLTYAWTHTSGPATPTISQPNGNTNAAAQFTPTVAGSYVIGLIVNDGSANSASDSVTITVNTVPVAVAAATGLEVAGLIVVGEAVTLDASGSTDADGNGTITGFSWTIDSQPTGSSISLSNSAVSQPTFTPTHADNYVFSLVVNDGVQNSDAAADTNDVLTLVANNRPVANAGSSGVAVVNFLKTLDGSASTDADAAEIAGLSYAWTIVSEPAGSSISLSSATAQKPTFTPTQLGAYVFSLVVNDGKHASNAVQVTYTAIGFSLDVDGSGGSPDALTDGVLIVRYLFGFTDSALTNGALGTGATRDASAIKIYLDQSGNALDIDGNGGGADALTDGVLIVRKLFGFTGSTLTAGALGTGSTRDATAIVNYINSISP